MNEHSEILGPSSSPETAALVTDLAKAQLEFRTAGFDSTNPHFKSKYSSYQACCEAVRDHLCKNGLALPDMKTGLMANGDWVMVGTLRHKSGQFITSIAPLWFGKKHMQEFGAACTYAKRQLLLGLVGAWVGEDDDDGNSLGEQAERGKKPAPKVAREPSQAQPTVSEEVSERMAAYEAAKVEQITNAPDRESARKFLDSARLRTKQKDITPAVLKRIEAAYNGVWEGGELA